MIGSFDFAAQQRVAKVLHHVVEVASHRSSRLPGPTVDRPPLGSHQWSFRKGRNKTVSCVFYQENVGYVLRELMSCNAVLERCLEKHSNCCASYHCKAAIELATFFFFFLLKTRC